MKFYVVLRKSSESHIISPSAHRRTLDCKVNAGLGGHAPEGRLHWFLMVPSYCTGEMYVSGTGVVLVSIVVLYPY